MILVYKSVNITRNIKDPNNPNIKEYHRPSDTLALL